MVIEVNRERGQGGRARAARPARRSVAGERGVSSAPRLQFVPHKKKMLGRATMLLVLIVGATWALQAVPPVVHRAATAANSRAGTPEAFDLYPAPVSYTHLTLPTICSV